MARHLIELSPETLAQLDLIAEAPAIDAGLLETIGMTPAEALRFAEATGNVPSADDVRCLIRAMGRAPELERLLALARQREAADEEQRGGLGNLIQALTLAAALGGVAWTLMGRLRTGRRAEAAVGHDSEPSDVEDAGPAIEGESAAEA
jgi:hypothetical protein